MFKKIYLMIIAILSILLCVAGLHAADEDLWTITNPPDILIVLDLSGSMEWPPQGNAANYFVTGSSCNASSNGPYYTTSGPGHTRACLASASGTNPILYVSGTTCNTNGPFYATSTPEHSWACYRGSTSTTQYGTSVPRYSTTACGEPFYKTSGSGHTNQCSGNTFSTNPDPLPQWSDSDCREPFYKNKTGNMVRCQRIDIAKYALFSIFNNDNSDNLDQINEADITSLGVRIGLMKFYNCLKGTQTNYTMNNSCIKLAWPISGSAAVHDPTSYASIFCNDISCGYPNTAGSNLCGSLEPPSFSTDYASRECVVGLGAKGGTPLQGSLIQALNYLNAHKEVDPARECRLKSVIFITDGEDTLACGSDGSQSGLQQRKAPVYQAKLLKDAGYDVWVIGFGADMPQRLKNTLNWMAYHGGTSKDETPTGDETAVTVPSGAAPNPCTNQGADPGAHYLSGYAFMATNPDELSSSIRSAITSILSGNYSFSAQAAVAAARVAEENFLYEASFEPRDNAGANKEPFWPGHLKKYHITNTGALTTPPCWDAGEKLAAQSPGNRNMWTYKGSGMVSYTTSAITDADLNVAPLSTSSCGTRCREIVGFYRGESAYNIEDWKLGDLFHTNPKLVTTPATFFYDPRQCGATSFAEFRNDNLRTAANGRQLILAGANDGQLHAFRTGNSASDCSSGGEEVWSFIPPNLLEKMGPIAHNSHADRSALASHQLFVDGPLQVADVWLPGSAATGTTKQKSEWKTIAVMALGGGGGEFLWSACSSCHCPYSPSNPSAVRYSGTFSAATPYYCGYYALDVTDSVTTHQPTMLWNLKPGSALAPYIGQPWSKMQIGRIKIAGNERWVGFIGGGFAGSGHAGKGFFVVDLKDGTIIWSYTRAQNAEMDFPAPAAPTALDTDNDGFADTVYMGDMGGNMWRFRLCPSDSTGCGAASYPSGCTEANWTASLLFRSSDAERGAALGINTSKQIFTKAVVAMDPDKYLWVYWGTGENNDPITRPADTNDTKNRLYAVKENKTFTGTYTTANLKNITSGVYCYSAKTEGCTIADSQNGWYINLSTNPLTISGPGGHTINNPVGEKMISDPALFGGMLMFPTYLPQQGEDTACGQAGHSFLYKLDYLTGSGKADEGRRTDYIGVGVGSSVLVSYRPGFGAADIYATASGGAGTSALTQQLGEAPSTSSMTNILYWKDRRLK